MVGPNWTQKTTYICFLIQALARARYVPNLIYMINNSYVLQINKLRPANVLKLMYNFNIKTIATKIYSLFFPLACTIVYKINPCITCLPRPERRAVQRIAREIHWQRNKWSCLLCQLCRWKLLRLLLMRSVFLARQMRLQIKTKWPHVHKSREESNFSSY